MITSSSQNLWYIYKRGQNYLHTNLKKNYCENNIISHDTIHEICWSYTDTLTLRFLLIYVPSFFILLVYLLYFYFFLHT